MGKHHEHDYSVQDETLLELSHTVGSFQGHHHHHHHHHTNTKFQRPKTLTNNVGLFALKKLNAMNPRILSTAQRRLLQPVAPGVITYMIYAGTLSLGAGYSVYIWRGYGFMAFVGKPVLPLIGLYVASKGAMYGINYLRQQLYAPQRRKLVDTYRNRYGESYLLDILDPTFKLSNTHQ